MDNNNLCSHFHFPTRLIKIKTKLIIFVMFDHFHFLAMFYRRLTLTLAFTTMWLSMGSSCTMWSRETPTNHFCSFFTDSHSFGKSMFSCSASTERRSCANYIHIDLTLVYGYIQLVHLSWIKNECHQIWQMNTQMKMQARIQKQNDKSWSQKVCLETPDSTFPEDTSSGGCRYEVLLLTNQIFPHSIKVNVRFHF